jgi:uncharacterized protein YggT (Ycf19 family)
MGLIDAILNLACVLLWLNWSSVHLAASRRPSPVSLAATLRKAEPRGGGRWGSLAAVFAVLLFRSIFYWNVGSASKWTPTLELGVMSLPFRSDFPGRMLLFSVLSFALVLGGLYAWMLLISVINRRVPNDDPFQRLVRIQLGRLDHWPPAVKLALPAAVTALAWGLGAPALARMGIVPHPESTGHVWQQALVLGITSILVWKLLVLSVCVLYIVTNHVYLGKSPFWHFVNTTGANLLAPMRKWPLRVGKLDLSPILALGVVLLAAHWADAGLPCLFQRLPF